MHMHGTCHVWHPRDPACDPHVTPTRPPRDPAGRRGHLRRHQGGVRHGRSREQLVGAAPRAALVARVA
eukprot:7387377-Prymnesium_polylepis.1